VYGLPHILTARKQFREKGMTEEYAKSRREYVAQIRNSFDTDTEDVRSFRGERGASSFSFGKIRFLAAMVCLVFFLVNKYSGLHFFHVSETEIIDIITDNHYYTNLQDYVKMLKKS
jgi:hypothetical protein